MPDPKAAAAEAKMVKVKWTGEADVREISAKDWAREGFLEQGMTRWSTAREDARANGGIVEVPSDVAAWLKSYGNFEVVDDGASND